MIPGPRLPTRRAAVDVGTNSVRLLVRDADGTTLAREMEVTRLGRGVDERGHLDDDALTRTLGVVGRYREIWESHDVTDVRIAATSAVRDAADRARFFDGVRDVAGVEARVLSGRDEAATTYLGTTRGVEAPRPTVVLDIGGGSTEMIVGDRDGEPVAEVSMQLGCVRLTERLIDSDPPTEAEMREARGEVAARLDRAADDLAARGGDPASAAALVAVAGTATTLAAIHLGLDGYDAAAIHATVIPADEVRELTSRLAAMTSEERAAMGAMAPGREDVIVAGALVLEGVVGRFGFDEVLVSEADILDGLVLLDRLPG